jgi:uncharacterized protein (UPF0261 family)
MPIVALLGTFDTKGHEYAFLRDRVREHGVETLLIDAGIHEPVGIEPDVSRSEVAAAGGADVTELANAGDRGAAVDAMARGAAALVARLHADGRLDAIVGLGGSGGSAIATTAMLASGDTRPYVGAVDVTMMYSVVDISGVNSISARIMTNAAAAIAGMAGATPPEIEHRPLVGATMFGVTTSCVTRARARLEALGYEVLVFHATGTGGQSMETLVAGGFLTGLLDVTTTELADELVGGVLSAGPDRLEAAGRRGIPQVVSLGALDMVNFGPRETVPPQFAHRNLYVHNPTVTLMRTTAEECGELGRTIGRKLSEATGPVAVFVPLGGVSAIDVDGQPFRDAEADEALFEALRQSLDSGIEVHELDLDVNDDRFADAMADRLHELIEAAR